MISRGGLFYFLSAFYSALGRIVGLLPATTLIIVDSIE
jgi:hypothetical protein